MLGVLCLGFSGAFVRRASALTRTHDAVLLATYATAGRGERIASSGNTVYLADASNGLLVFDLSDPAQPRQIGTYRPTDGYINRIAAAGTVVYLGDRDNGLRVVDVTDPTRPTETAFLPAPGVTGIAVASDRVFVANSGYAGPDRPRAVGGLHIIDVTDPRRSREIGFLELGGAYEVAAAGAYAYLRVDNELRIVDVADPANPRIVGS